MGIPARLPKSSLFPSNESDDYLIPGGRVWVYPPAWYIPAGRVWKYITRRFMYLAIREWFYDMNYLHPRNSRIKFVKPNGALFFIFQLYFCQGFRSLGTKILIFDAMSSSGLDFLHILILKFRPNQHFSLGDSFSCELMSEANEWFDQKFRFERTFKI